ncbi:cytochrome o ubiquinol oxidase subunit IV [Sphingomonas sp. BGYR3]|uniref:cytochrome o ubiquinol oxidase subunit IV n=1 Tax=Sphingomonas sp. BGYR3 TaxID=2975483 RepID=UPI0021A41B33|nr:cytochrome o ubiquinol oxidase subunit IV [Sphingomonas sp. BGYR3]MDG5487247.1 cytochrome o ubiquinol oxidase subunit IV [Sphingomonas sp. BGYR3]
MSAEPVAVHGDDANEHHGIEIPHATMRDYVTGFVLSVLLTAIPFGLVMTGALSPAVTAVTIMLFAVAQIIVHMIYFLHMTPKAEGGWSLTSLVFTIIVVFIMLAGSLWVMSHLNSNMMPMPQGMEMTPDTTNPVP